MPEMAQILNGVRRKWILKEPLSKGGDKDVWLAYDFTAYLIKAGLNPDTITVNQMTRSRYIQECLFMYGDPKYAVRLLSDPSEAACEQFTRQVEILDKLDDARIIKIQDYMLMPPKKEIKEEEFNPFAPAYRPKAISGSHPAAHLPSPAVKEEEEDDKFLPFYVMDKIEGETFEKIAGKKKAYEGKIPESLSLMKEIGGALVTAHNAGLIHTDLQPKNIFIKEDGTPVIIDFGICYFAQGKRFSLTGDLNIAIDFIPPELTAIKVDEKNVCPANDVYIFGKLLYYLISGGKTLPRESHRLPEYDLRTRYPSKLMDLVYKIFDQTICGDIGERMQTVDDLLAMINREMIEGTACIYCKVGRYCPIEFDKLGGFGASDQPGSGTFEVRHYACEKCGNLQQFCDTSVVHDIR